MRRVFYFYFLLSTITAFSLPEIQEVVSGTVDVTQVDHTMMVLKVSDKTILNHKAFNIDVHERVQFVQPSSSSYVLNRVIGKNSSSILGSLSSNGKLFLVNPQGIYFGPSSSINVGSLVASTLDISN